MKCFILLLFLTGVFSRLALSSSDIISQTIHDKELYECDYLFDFESNSCYHVVTNNDNNSNSSTDSGGSVDGGGVVSGFYKENENICIVSHHFLQQQQEQRQGQQGQNEFYYEKTLSKHCSFYPTLNSNHEHNNQNNNNNNNKNYEFNIVRSISIYLFTLPSLSSASSSLILHSHNNIESIFISSLLSSQQLKNQFSIIHSFENPISIKFINRKCFDEAPSLIHCSSTLASLPFTKTWNYWACELSCTIELNLKTIFQLPQEIVNFNTNQQNKRSLLESAQASLTHPTNNRKDTSSPCSGCTFCIETDNWFSFTTAASFASGLTLNTICINTPTLTRPSSSSAISISGKNIIIKSVYPTNTRILQSDTGFGNKIFVVGSRSTVTFSKITFDSIKCTQQDGCILYQQSLSTTNIEDCVFSSNSITDGSNWWGVVIYSENSYLNIKRSEFHSNSYKTANNDNLGGTIYSSSNSRITIESSVFTDNTAGGQGGAIYSSSSSLLISNSTFSGNRALSTTSTSGSALHFIDSGSNRLGISRCVFSNNSFENVADLAVSENNAVVFVSVSAGKTVFGIASSVFELNEQSTNHITISGQQGGALDFYPFNTCLPSVKLVLSETFTYTLFNAGTRIVSGLNNFCSHCSLVSGSAFDSQAYCDTLGSSAVNCTSLEIINSDELELVTCPTTGCTAPNVFDVLLCVPECSVGFYAPTTTGICGETCQPDRIYGIDSNGFCSLCPADLFFNPATSACVPLNECPRSAPYGDPSTGLCVSNAFECSLYLPLIDPESKLCVKSCKLSEYPESTTNICRPCSSSVSCTHCIYKDDWSYFASLVTSVFTPSGSLFCLLSDITRPSNYSSPLIVSGKSLSFINIMENSHATISPADSRSSATKIFSFSNSIISFDSVIFKGFKVKNNDGSVISVQSASVLTLENCKFISNSITQGTNYWGVAVYSSASTLNINNCLFQDNSHRLIGNGNSGIVYTVASLVTIQNTNFTDNSVGGAGIVYSTSSNIALSNVVFSNNTASSTNPSGVAIHFVADSSTPQSLGVVRVTFSDNYYTAAGVNASPNSGVVFVNVIGNANHTIGFASSNFEPSLLASPSLNLFSLAGSTGSATYYTFNTCLTPKFIATGAFTYSLVNSGTRAVEGSRNFCSVCDQVLSSLFGPNAYCNLHNQTIDCETTTLSETLVVCSSDLCLFPNFFEEIICLPKCSSDFFATVKTRVCSQTCPDDFSYEITYPNRYCSKCPEHNYFNEQNSSCGAVESCPEDASFGDPSTGLCVSAPSNCSPYLPFADVPTRLCVTQCDISRAQNNETKTCLECLPSVACTHCISEDNWSYFTSNVASSSSGSTICIKTPSLTRPTSFASSSITISNKTLAFYGASSSLFPYDAAVSGSSLFSLSNATVSFESLSFNRFKTNNQNGGVISLQSASVLTLRSCMFLGNSLVSTLRSGVVIYSASSSVTIEGCVFDSNYHTTVSNRNTGGVLSADSSSVFLIKNSVFSNNTAGGEGGVLYSLGSSVVIQNSTFSKNIAGATSVSGSAVHFVADSVSRSLAIVSCSFSSNSFSGAKNANSAVIFVQLTGTSDATHTFGIASSSISTATSDLNSITLSGTASSAGTLVFYPFNTCIASLKVVSFTGSNYVLQNSGTRATATDMNSFCSTCKSVLSSSPFPESYYCSLLSSTIDCPLLKSTEVLNDCKSLSCAAPLFFEDIFCVSKCSEGMYAPVETGICVKNCPPASSNPSTLGYCSKCPTGLFYDPATKSCVTLDKCSASAPYGDPSTGYCIQSGLDCSTYLPVLDKDSKLCVAACQPSQFINTVDNSCQLCSSSVSCSFCVTSSDWNSFAALANSAASNSAICVRSPTLIRPPQATTVNIDSKTLQFISVLDSKANVVVTQSDTSTANTRSFILKNSDISIIGFTFSQLRCATEDGCVCNAQTSTKLLLKGCQFLNNKILTGTATWGIVVSASASTVTIKNSDFTSNSHAVVNNNNKGVISAVSSSTITIRNSNFANNIVGGEGGVVYSSSSFLSVGQSNFTGNKAQTTTASGSAIHFSADTVSRYLEIGGCVFNGNQFGTTKHANSAVIYVTVVGSAAHTIGLATSSFDPNSGSPYKFTLAGSTGSETIVLYNTCDVTIHFVVSGSFTYNLKNSGTRAVTGLNNFCSVCGLVTPLTNSFCKIIPNVVNCDSLVSTDRDCACYATGTYRNEETDICGPALSCPSGGSFGDPNRAVCITDCSTTSNPFGDTINKVCTTATGCSLTAKPYGDRVSHTCTDTCPSGESGDSLTNLCCKACPSGMYPILGACSLVSNGGCVNTASVCSPDGTDGLCKCNSTTVDCSLASFPTGFPSFSSVLSSVTQIIMGPNSFTRIPSSAFTGLTSVTKIVLQAESITRVFSGAFLGLPALQEIEFTSTSITMQRFSPGTFFGIADGVVLTFSGNPTISAEIVTYSESEVIKPCHSSCITCYGAGSSACCPANCLKCSSGGVCSSCIDGFALDETEGICVSDFAASFCGGSTVTNGLPLLGKFSISNVLYGRNCFINSEYFELTSGFTVRVPSTGTTYCCRNAGVIMNSNGYKMCSTGCRDYEKEYANYAWVDSLRATDGDNIGSRCYVNCFLNH